MGFVTPHKRPLKSLLEKFLTDHSDSVCPPAHHHIHPRKVKSVKMTTESNRDREKAKGDHGYIVRVMGFKI